MVFLIRLIKQRSQNVFKKLNEKLDQYHLLNHPFYKSWNEGNLLGKLLKIMLNNIINTLKRFQDI